MYQKERQELIVDIVQDIQQELIEYYKTVKANEDPHTTLIRFYDILFEYVKEKSKPL